MQIVSIGDNLHEMSKPIFPRRQFALNVKCENKNKKNISLDSNEGKKKKAFMWLGWMRDPTGDQEVASSTPTEVGNILSWRLIMKYFLRSFSPFH